MLNHFKGDHMTRLIFRLQALTVVITMLLASVIFSSQPAIGQETSTGTIVGTITDATGAAIPNATVTLTDVATKAIRKTLTNKEGQYTLVNVTPGTYDLSATSAGFSTDVISGEVVSVGTQTTANFKMMVGAQTTTVEVQASNADLQTQNASVSQTVDPVMVNSLPAIGRDVSSFAAFEPGVTPAGNVAGTVHGPGRLSA